MAIKKTKTKKGKKHTSYKIGDMMGGKIEPIKLKKSVFDDLGIRKI